MSKTSVLTRPAIRPGDIRRAPIRFEDQLGWKVRPVLIVSVEGAKVAVRAFYTKDWPGRRPVWASYLNGLDHKSYLSDRVQTIDRKDLLGPLGFLDDHLDPFGDFKAA